MHYINNRGGEVYVKVFLSSSAQVYTLDCSIDKVKGCEVFAYMNEREFINFSNSNMPNEVLTHPGDR